MKNQLKKKMGFTTFTLIEPKLESRSKKCVVEIKKDGCKVIKSNLFNIKINKHSDKVIVQTNLMM